MKKSFFLFLFCVFSTSLYAQCWQSVSTGSAYTLAVKSDGTLWGWGFNAEGQLGNGTTSDTSVPVRIGTASNWKIVSAGNNHSLAIKTDGTLWAWGGNLWGQVGNGTLNQRNTPLQIGTATNWKSVSAGLGFSVAIKTDGTLWSWGDNFYGQLGFSNPAFTPTQVGTATNWESVSAGGNHTLAVKTDGTLWASGYNGEGQLGDGTTTNKNTFTRIGTATNWKSVAAGYDFSLALQTDGTLWSWGNNDNGQLGDGSMALKTSPAQVGSATNWRNIAAGYANSLAIRTNSTLWAWGYNIGGIVFGEDENKTTPTQLGTDSNWQSIDLGDYHAMAFQTSGTLWGWGDNTWGRLGNESWMDEPLPVLLFTASPVGETSQAFCSSATVANLQATGSAVKWYTAASGGSPLPANTVLVNGNHYYATQTLAGCESFSRLDVTVSINTTPTAAPAGSANQIFCYGTTVAGLTATGINVKWYASASGGSPLSSSTLLEEGVHYFASQTIAGCESVSRLDVTATANGTITPAGSATQSFCANATVNDLLATGTNLKWYTSEFGGVALNTNTPLVNATIYYASQTIGSLESCHRLAVRVTVHSTPPPTGPASQLFCNSATIENLSVSGQGGVFWYETPAGGEPMTFESPLADGVHYYASQIVNSCESIVRFDVLVHINTTPTPAPTGLTTQIVCPESTIESLSVTGTDVKWYSAPVDGYLIPADMILVNGESYYASQTINTCESTSRLAVTVSINNTPSPALSAISKWQAREVAAGYEFSLAIMDDGSLWAWGNNNSGQLGNGTTKKSDIPVQVGTQTDWKHVSAGGSSSVAVKNDGTLWAWGVNGGGMIPKQVGSDTNWKYASTSGAHVLALKTDGSLWAWGNNYFGQLGDGSRISNEVPIRIGTDNDWKEISAGGFQSVAIKNNGAMWAWGRIGGGVHDGVSTAVEIDFYSNWRSVSAGSSHILAIRADGTLWSWGSNEYSQLGNGMPVSFDNEPKKIGNDTDWKTVSAGLHHSIAIKQNGVIWSWGQNNHGQLGNAVINQIDVPTPITTDADFQHISAGGSFTLSMKADGSVWVWGRNYFGELGDGTSTDRQIPTALSSTQQNFCPGALVSALSVTGDNIKWYNAQSGGSALAPSTVLQAGNFYYATQTVSGRESCLRTSIKVTTNPALTPSGSSIQVLCSGSVISDLKVNESNVNWYNQAVGGSLLNPSNVLVNDQHYFASQRNGHCESTSRLEVEVDLNATLPAAPTGATSQSFCSDARISNLVAAGNEITWYENPTGGTPLKHEDILMDAKHYYATQTINACKSSTRLDVLVHVSATEKPLPLTEVSNNWESLSLLSHSGLGLKKDGSLWGWGDNFFAQLGNGTAYNSVVTPVQSGTDSWVSVAAGEWHSAGVKANGTLWAWGDNHALQSSLLGDGKRISKSEPNQVGTDADWKSVSVSFNFNIALKKDGTLWGWGDNEYGQLADGTTTDRSTPTRIGNSSDWISITAGWRWAFAIKSDGSLWAWGYNGQGQLGDGTTNGKKVLTRIGTSSDWKFIATGGECTFGIKRDGSLWAWGANNAGQLGDGTYTRSLVPKRIGTATNWQSIATAIQNVHTLAVKTDGTLWGWGTRDQGELGDGTYGPIPVIVPGQIGTANDWAAADVGRFYSSAIKKDGTLWAWGTGQLGLGESQSSFNTPQLVSSPSMMAFQQVCMGSTVANLSAQGTNVQWYASPSGGTPLPGSTLLVPGNHYYATQTVSGCESVSRLDVFVMIKETTPPNGNSTQAFCSGATVANLSATGANVKWYSAPTGGTLLSVSAVLINGAQYYASQTVDGCESPRLSVLVAVNEPLSPGGSTTQTFCAGATLANISASGVNIKWYSTLTGITPLAVSTVLTNGSHYYASQTVNGCESLSRLEVSTIVQTTPAPTGVSPQVFEIGKTLDDIIIAGSNVKWYATAGDAILRINSLPRSHELVIGMTYYATQTTLGCESLESLAITISSITGIESNDHHVRFHPNPVDDYLEITMGNTVESIIVTNSIGQPVLDMPVHNTHLQLDFTLLQSGIYFIKLQSKNGTSVHKVVKR